MRNTILAALVIGVGCVSAATAQSVININLVSTSGNGGNNINFNMDGTAYTPAAGPLSYTGTVWNDIEGLNAGGLEPSDGGGATSLSYSLSRRNGLWANDTTGDAGDPTEATDALLPLNNYSFINTDDPTTITFAGLTPADSVDLYILASGDADGQGGDYTIDGVTKTSQAINRTIGDGWTEGENYVSFLGLTPNASGQILVDMARTPTFGFAAVGGFQLSVTSNFDACDVNLNGVCNSTDFGIISDNIFQAGTFGDGDLDGSGTVDFQDYRIFKDHPNRVVGFDAGAGSASAPEPATTVMLAICSAVMTVFGRRRRS